MRNGIIGGVEEAICVEYDLITSACSHFGVSYSKNLNSKTKINIFTTLQDYFAKLGYPRFKLERESKLNDIVSRFGLHIARCEAARETKAAPDSWSKLAADLPFGPLEKISFVPNYTLNRVLDVISGREELNRIQQICAVCMENLTAGNTVRSKCACYARTCQLCVRHSIKHYANTYNSRSARCCSCNRGTILVEGVQEARRVEQELLRDLPQYKPGAGKALLYSLYTDLSQICGIPKSIDYSIFMSQDHTGKEATRPMCNLELARLCQERLRRFLLNVPAGQASDVSELSLGPLAYLSIDCDVFLEAFLVFLDGPADPPDTTGQVLNDPRCCFDEATNRVRQTHQPGGELSREVAAEAEAERLRQDAAEDQTELGRDLTLLLRSAHTPCPYEGCSVDPQCSVYLDKHIARYHPGWVQKAVAPVTPTPPLRRGFRPSPWRRGREGTCSEDLVHAVAASKLDLSNELMKEMSPSAMFVHTGLSTVSAMVGGSKRYSACEGVEQRGCTKRKANAAAVVEQEDVWEFSSFSSLPCRSSSETDTSARSQSAGLQPRSPDSTADSAPTETAGSAPDEETCSVSEDGTALVSTIESVKRKARRQRCERELRLCLEQERRADALFMRAVLFTMGADLGPDTGVGGNECVLSLISADTATSTAVGRHGSREG